MRWDCPSDLARRRERILPLTLSASKVPRASHIWVQDRVRVMQRDGVCHAARMHVSQFHRLYKAGVGTMTTTRRQVPDEIDEIGAIGLRWICMRDK